MKTLKPLNRWFDNQGFSLYKEKFMKKLLLIDGNSMLFRAYYGTQSRGPMTSRDGTTTNAVYGFSTMLTKALDMMKPDYCLVAFDTGKKTFRHDMYETYKGTRKEVDPELVSQFALVREFLDAYPLPRVEVDGYEADDLIGTLSRKFDGVHVDILTSDRDMLQLISDTVHVHLMKKGLTDIKVMDIAALQEEYNLTPSQIIDVKALQGDASDNIPGVPSIGPKTATTLINTYGTLDAMYEHADELKGKAGEKIREFEAQARMSYELAKIYCEVPNTLELNDLVFALDATQLNGFYRKYDMNSLIKERLNEEAQSLEVIELKDFNETWVQATQTLALDTDKSGEVVGVYLYNGTDLSYLTRPEMVMDAHFANLLGREEPIVVLDSKPLYRFALQHGLHIATALEDILLLSFITDSSITSLDILKDSYQLWETGLDPQQTLCKDLINLSALYPKLLLKAQKDGVMKVYEEIERPLVKVLAKCEHEGIHVDRRVLDKIADETLEKIQALSQEIYALAGQEFNINSPKQLGEILFDVLELPAGKKRSTAVSVLESLEKYHPIIRPILSYRKYQKLYSTYAVGLVKHIQADGKIHTTFNQHATQTGRLSSSDPNLQNISVRDEETKAIRGAFVASPGRKLLSIDYSQIELRVLAHLSNESAMIEGFKNHEDIHTSTAQQIFGVTSVDSIMRRQAKAVNFGIVYGISAFGLAAQLDTGIDVASDFINRYNAIYPNITKYMDAMIEECQQKGYVTTFFGRRRYIPEIFDKNRAVKEFGKRAAMNAPIQGTAADIIKLAMIAADRAITNHNLKSTMILQVHDELVFDVLEDEIEIMKSIMVETMTKIVDWSVPMEVSVDLGDTWMD